MTAIRTILRETARPEAQFADTAGIFWREPAIFQREPRVEYRRNFNCGAIRSRLCLFSTRGLGGSPVWLIRHDKGEFPHEEVRFSNGRGVSSPEHRRLRYHR